MVCVVCIPVDSVGVFTTSQCRQIEAEMAIVNCWPNLVHPELSSLLRGSVSSTKVYTLLYGICKKKTLVAVVLASVASQG